MNKQDYTKVLALSIHQPIPVEMVPLVIQYAQDSHNPDTSKLVARWVQGTMRVAMNQLTLPQAKSALRTVA